MLEDLEAFLRAQSAADGVDVGASLVAETASAAPPVADQFVARTPGLPNGTYEYEPHQPRPSAGALHVHVAELVVSEGPLHRDELFQALRDDLGYGRIGSTIRSRFSRAAAEAVRRDLVVKRDDWYWPPGAESHDVRVPVGTGDAKRPIEWYAPEELMRAMQIACREAELLPQEELPALTVRLLGQKATRKGTDRIASLLPLALEQGYLTSDGVGVRAQQPGT